jgi:hypothetical protein
MMKRIRKLNDSASVGMYIIVLFGLIVMMYMFGFTNTLDAYMNAKVGDTSNESNISNPHFVQDTNPLILILTAMLSFVQHNLMAVFGGIVGLIAVFAIGKLAGIDLWVVWTYILPIAILMVFMNLVIFPVDTISGGLSNMIIWSIPVSAILIIFFNLMLILSIIEFVRTGTTT